MHPEAMRWVAEHATDDAVTVLDIGGRNVNGTPRDLFPHAALYRTLDILAGDGVDIVADAATWVPDREYDVVISTECFEHTPFWRDICVTAFKACKPGGRLILTMAGPGRQVHSGVDGGPDLKSGEFYENVDPQRLRRELEAIGWREVSVDYQATPGDTRAAATK